MILLESDRWLARSSAVLDPAMGVDGATADGPPIEPLARELGIESLFCRILSEKVLISSAVSTVKRVFKHCSAAILFRSI